MASANRCLTLETVIKQKVKGSGDEDVEYGTHVLLP